VLEDPTEASVQPPTDSSPGTLGALTQLQQWAETLVRTQEEILGILLLGPLTVGRCDLGAHHDIIVVVESSESALWQRSRKLPRVSVELHHQRVVLTRQEFRRLREAGNFFIRRALTEGMWLAREEVRPPDAPTRRAPSASGCIG